MRAWRHWPSSPRTRWSRASCCCTGFPRWTSTRGSSAHSTRSGHTWGRTRAGWSTSAYSMAWRSCGWGGAATAARPPRAPPSWGYRARAEQPRSGSHAGGVEYLGVFDGVAKLRLEGSCNGCPSSTVTVQLAIQGAVEAAAPEVTQVLVEGMTEPAPAGPKLLQIGIRPPTEGTGPGSGPAPTEGSGGTDAGSEVGWVTLPN